MVTTKRTQFKSAWKWPVIAEDTVITGDSNLNRVTSSPLKDIQIECYPGAHFQNLTNMLKAQHKYRKIPKNIIVNVGINDLNSNVLFTPKTYVFVCCRNSAADISKPHTFKLGNVGGRRFSVGELHTASKTSSANGSHLNVWGFDISVAEFPQQKKRVSLV